LIAQFFTPILLGQYDQFYIEEDVDENLKDTVNSACFYAIQNGEKFILIQNIHGKMVYGWGQ
jgi:hypothetical protein